MDVTKNKAIFLDRDGTLIKHIPFLADPRLVELKDGVAECLKKLKQKGFLLIVVTNQSGVARGLFDENAVKKTNDRLIEAIIESGGPMLDGIYYCPHHPDGVIPEYSICCSCRKPSPGMIIQARIDHNIDLGSSVIIGDNYMKDILLGLSLGLRTIYIAPKGTDVPNGVMATVSDFHDIAEIIFSDL